MSPVQIIVGSRSDLPHLRASELRTYLSEQGIISSVSICSAHRNAEELRSRIVATWETTATYVCAAGWSAALPGAVRAHLLPLAPVRVFGIALPSEEYPDAQDAEISIKRLPPGIEVTYGGIGTTGFNNIMREVRDVVTAFRQRGSRHTPFPTAVKPPQFDIQLPIQED